MTREHTTLVADQTQRFRSLDPLLPDDEPVVPDARLVEATLVSGRVIGVLTVREVDAGTGELWEFTPYVGYHGRAGMNAILRALLAELDRTPPPSGSRCTIVWPSRDAECTRALLDHRLFPATALGVRVSRAGPVASPVQIRPADAPDAEALSRLLLGERDRRSPVRASGSGRHPTVPTTAWPFLPPAPDDLLAALRPGTPERVRHRLWVAEDAGGLVGTIAATEPHRSARRSPNTTALASDLRWGFLHHLVVAPTERGRGVGRALVDRAHADLTTADQACPAGTALRYRPLDPVTAVFWHRRGYRPLWMMWSHEPITTSR